MAISKSTGLSLRKATTARSSHRSQRPPPAEPRKLTDRELLELSNLLRDRLLGGKEARPFQLALVRAQEERQDALLQAATGQGKTAIAAGPYMLAHNHDKVTLMVSPLIGLQTEMVRITLSFIQY
jgi:superfamily II DNA helicase RecQ